MTQGTKQGQTQGPCCFSQGKGGLRGTCKSLGLSSAQPSSSLGSIRAEESSGGGRVREEGTCMPPYPRKQGAEEGQTSAGSCSRGADLLAVLQTRSLRHSGWRDRDSPHLASLRTHREELQRGSGSRRSEGRSLQTGSTQGCAQEQEDKTYGGKVRVAFPHANGSVGAEKMLNKEKHCSNSCPRSAPLPRHSRDRFRGRDRLMSSR